MLFIDFKATYDTIFRSKPLTMMEELGIPDKLVRLVRCVLMKFRYKVKIGDCTSDAFNVVVGLRQSYPLTPLLFFIALQAMLLKWTKVELSLIKRHRYSLMHVIL